LVYTASGSSALVGTVNRDRCFPP